MAIEFLLLAMQAAGSIIDINATRKQQKYIQLGREMEQSAIEANLEALSLESAQSSLEEMRELRRNLGTQIAFNAARGTSGSAGSALISGQKSISTFNEDERKRRFNLLSREATLRANNVLSGLHTLQSETQLGQALTSRTLQNTLLSSEIGAGIKKVRQTGIAKRFGFGLEEA